MKLLLFLIATCTASFCINGMYEYSYDESFSNTSRHEIVQSYSTVMTLNLETEKLFSRRIEDVQPGDYILSHNGYFTYVKEIRRVNITNPQLYCRKNVDDRGEFRISAGLQGTHNVVFTDSQLNVINETVKYYNGNITVKQYGLYNFTDNINYHIDYSPDGEMEYYLNGIDVINQAAIVDFMNENEITSFKYDMETYTNVVNIIHSCEGIDLITESNSVIVNGLFFF
jgi:hypothetical protein